MKKFTEQLHQAASNLWQQSMHHPFIKQLEDGTLPLKKFRFYLLQDRYYLEEFSKFHELVAQQADTVQTQKFLLDGAQSLRDSEISIREQFFQQLKITSAEIAQTEIAPTAYNYVNHLQTTLQRDGVNSAVAAIVPCYWLYQELGQAMANSGSPVSYYQAWIDTYDSDWYAVNVKQILTLTEQLATNATLSEQQKMQRAFLRSSYYELQFWQMALDKEKWQ
ncbi:thiaminase II [Lactobacillus sp. ESL0684]|uniref:thiaminase II n=1 Tax=Lactobacillus sp. ESL0684 TaxID=2983213 RepID=UPI0023F7338B|nr:thiaminase II [Lactobacillus sp. ESL0684]WEV43621.1 thiaminase II [Lactobacillus sp. ESL0684]